LRFHAFATATGRTVAYSRRGVRFKITGSALPGGDPAVR